MALKVFFGVIAVILMGTYLIAPLLKLKDVALAVVLLIGLGLMIFDLWQSLQSKED